MTISGAELLNLTPAQIIEKASLKCESCGKPVIGAPELTDGKVVCPSCYFADLGDGIEKFPIFYPVARG